MESFSDIDKWAFNTIENWQGKNIKLNQGAPLELIEKTETSLSIKFPDPFVALYKKANGFNNWDWNEHMFSIWPLERMIEESKDNIHPDFIGFSDWLINSHCIGFVRNQPGIYKYFGLKDYPDPMKITDSFEEAIEMINKGSDKLF